MVIDVEIDDLVINMFPRDFIERRRIEGICLYQKPIDQNDAELSRFVCNFTVPSCLIPLFTIGKKGLVSRLRDTSAHTKILGKKLTLFLAGEPIFSLNYVGENSFTVLGVAGGLFLKFAFKNDRVSEVQVILKGMPEDLFSAVMGVKKEPNVSERTVVMPTVTQQDRMPILMETL